MQGDGFLSRSSTSSSSCLIPDVEIPPQGRSDGIVCGASLGAGDGEAVTALILGPRSSDLHLGNSLYTMFMICS